MQARASAGPASAGPAGYSVVELLFALGLLLTLSAVAVPQALVVVDDYRTLGAVRYVTGRLQDARVEAITRGVDIGLRFVETGGYTMTPYLDGNGTGVLSRDIATGADPPLSTPVRLSDLFAGVDFGLADGLPPVESGSPAPAGDPIKLGASDILSFGPLGSCSPGSLYLKGPDGQQYVIRLYGATGRVRVLTFDRRTRRWRPA
jgi:Type II transport protein GspH